MVLLLSSVSLVLQVNEFEPVAALTASRFSLVEVHPVYTECILLTWCTQQTKTLQFTHHHMYGSESAGLHFNPTFQTTRLTAQFPDLYPFPTHFHLFHESDLFSVCSSLFVKIFNASNACNTSSVEGRKVTAFIFMLGYASRKTS